MDLVLCSRVEIVKFNVMFFDGTVSDRSLREAQMPNLMLFSRWNSHGLFPTISYTIISLTMFFRSGHGPFPTIGANVEIDVAYNGGTVSDRSLRGLQIPKMVRSNGTVRDRSAKYTRAINIIIKFG